MADRTELYKEEIARAISEVFTSLGYKSDYKFVSEERRIVFAVDSPCLMCGVRSNMRYSRDEQFLTLKFHEARHARAQSDKERLLSDIGKRIPIKSLEIKRLPV